MTSSTAAEFEARQDLVAALYRAIFEIIFSLGVRTGYENKGSILINIAPLFLRAPRGKELESGPLEGSNQVYIAQPIQVELLRRRLRLVQIQGVSLSNSQLLNLIEYN